MLIGFVCVFLASLLPLLWIAFAKVNAGFKGKHNYDPRKFMEQAEGRAHRALCAEKNALEAFPMFAAAVIIASICQVNELSIALISILYIIVRVFHGVCYIANCPKERSLVWFVGVGCCATLYLLSIFTYSA